jgi:hypothetical protein
MMRYNAVDWLDRVLERIFETLELEIPHLTSDLGDPCSVLLHQLANYLRSHRRQPAPKAGAGAPVYFAIHQCSLKVPRVETFSQTFRTGRTGELALNAAEVSDARWLTVEEICRLESTFEDDREFYRTILPSLAS